LPRSKDCYNGSAHLVERRLGNASVRCGERLDTLRGQEDALWGTVMGCRFSNLWPRHIKNDLCIPAAEAEPGIGSKLRGVFSSESVPHGWGYANVQERVHHARHGDWRPRTNRYQKWRPGRTQLAAQALAQALKMLSQSVVKSRRPSLLEDTAADVRRDGETGRHTETKHLRHFGKIGALPTKELRAIDVSR
jgi:hypothetical protein